MRFGFLALAFVVFPACAFSPNTSSMQSVEAVTSEPSETEMERFALVIGNSDYTNGLQDLQKTDEDAIDMSNTLKALGFNVYQEKFVDFDKDGMLDVSEQFFNTVEQFSKPKVALIFYSGHGVERRRRNLMLPVDAKVGSYRAIASTSVALSDWLDRLEISGADLNIVLIDACREDPFSAEKDADGTVDGGLREEAYRENTIVFYGAQPGHPALENYNANLRNSEFTAALLNRINRPIFLETFWRETLKEVKESTEGDQIPQAIGINENTVTFCFATCPGDLSTFGVRPLPPRRLIRSSAAVTKGFSGASNESAKFNIGDSKTDCDGCPEVVAIPAGQFQQGSLPNERRSELNEKPARLVHIPRTLWVARYEVTVADWMRCVEDGICSNRPPTKMGRHKKKSNNPIDFVSWSDTQDFLRWINSKAEDGLPSYRLPTESEWEYFARAGTSGEYSNDLNRNHVCEIANTQGRRRDNYVSGRTRRVCRDGFSNVSPAGSFQSNLFGLYDVFGNVEEWVQDCYKGSYHDAPQDGTAVTSNRCTKYVVRGGGHTSLVTEARSAARHAHRKNERREGTGFRIVRDSALGEIG